MDNDPLTRLHDENELLRNEVRVSRESAAFTAQLVIQQFEETAKVLDRLEVANVLRSAVLDAASRISIVAADTDGTITLFNKGAERMLGYRAEEIVGTRSLDLFHLPAELDTQRKRLEARLSRSVTGPLALAFALNDITHEGEWTYVRKDGTRFPVSLSVSPMRGRDRRFGGCLCAAMDITHLKEAEREILRAKNAAESANRAKSSFLANMSHELRTPLNAIIGYSEMLQEEAIDAGQTGVIEDLRKIHGAGRHLLTLINDILDLSKIEAGRMELFIEPFDLAPAIEDVAETVQAVVAKNRNNLEVRGLDRAGGMVGDVTRVRQILFNLLSNASKFTHDGSITLDVERRRSEGEGWIVLRVADTGIGMTPEQSVRVFEPFSQGDASTTRKYGGTGLGLPITRKICDMMGGWIDLSSSPGKGSVFTVYLPAVISSEDQRKPEQAQVQPAAPVGVPSQRKALPTTPGASCVLVVDDDPTARHLMEQNLTRSGFQVVAASNGPDGLRLAREIRPAVITLDVLMPVMDGWAVLRELKSDPALAEIPVVMVTIVDDQNLGFMLGASDYLLKPVSRDRLVSVMRKYRKTSQSGSILIVEDDPEPQEFLARMVEQEGWKAVRAENGQVGLERVAESRPDVILLDLMMPVMDGFAFLDVLRRQAVGRDIPVIVVTAKDLTQDEYVRLRGDVLRILRKSTCNYEDLVRKIRGLMAAREATVAGGQDHDPGGRPRPGDASPDASAPWEETLDTPGSGSTR